MPIERSEEGSGLTIAEPSREKVLIHVYLGFVMRRHIVTLSAFFVQAKPVPFALREVVFDVHGNDRTDASKAEHHRRDEGSIPKARNRFDLDAVEELPRLVGAEHRRLALLDDVLRTANGCCGVHRYDLADNEKVEEHADGGEVLLYGRTSDELLLLLDVSGDQDGVEMGEREFVEVTPIAELSYRSGVRRASVSVADMGREKLDEAKPTFLPTVKEQPRHGSTSGNHRLT